MTQEKGIRTTCGPELMYVYKKPVLTNEDVAEARLAKYDFTSSGSGVMFSVSLKLTEEARQKLKKDFRETGRKELAVLIDGQYWGARSFADESSIDTNVPQAGFMTVESDAARIVEACKRTTKP